MFFFRKGAPLASEKLHRHASLLGQFVYIFPKLEAFFLIRDHVVIMKSVVELPDFIFYLIFPH